MFKLAFNVHMQCILTPPMYKGCFNTFNFLGGGVGEIKQYMYTFNDKNTSDNTHTSNSHSYIATSISMQMEQQ